MKRFRAVENAYSRFEVLLLQARSKRETLKGQIARLNIQLKNAKDDAEVQKLAGSLKAAERPLSTRRHGGHRAPANGVPPSPQREPEGIGEVAAKEISRERNQELRRLAAEAEAELPDFSEANSDLPPGF